MAARKFYRESTPNRDTSVRPRDSVIDELPPEETEKMGYVWVVKGTLTEEEEREAAKFGSMSDIHPLPTHEISGCNFAKEKVHELIAPPNGEEATRGDDIPFRGTTDDFRLYIPSFVRQMHSLLSRPPELIRRDTISVQEILKLMPDSLFDRRSYIEHMSRYLDLYQRPQEGLEPSESAPEKQEDGSEDVVEPEKPEKEKEDAETAEPETEGERAIEITKLEEEQPEGKSGQEEELSQRKLGQEDDAGVGIDRNINAVYADPEIDTEGPQSWLKPLYKNHQVWLERKAEQGEPSSRDTEKKPFIRDYILRKVEDLEKKLKRVDYDIYGSKERQVQLKYQLYEMEILKLVEKISQADTPSETDVAKLEYLTDQLKIAQGKKTSEE